MSNFPIAINPYRRPIVIKTDIIAKIIAGMLFLVEKKVPIFNIRIIIVYNIKYIIGTTPIVNNFTPKATAMII
jgi:hypothetical protein